MENAACAEPNWQLQVSLNKKNPPSKDEETLDRADHPHNVEGAKRGAQPGKGNDA